jgi:ATP-dependent Clp protease ATP-binding subunit ClpX
MAYEFHLGARGLRSICESVMTDAMFELPSQKDVRTFTVTAEFCLEKMSKEKVNRLKVA